jgi:hypothetical protein
VLAELLTDPERAISQAAQDGLSTLPGAAADEVVVALLNDNDTARRLVALEILGRRRVPAAVPALWNRTTDSDARVRAAALRRVSEQADPAELLRLLNLLAQTTTPQDLSTVAQAVGTLAVRANDADGTATVLGGRLAALTPAQQAALLDAVGSVGGARALETVRAALRSEHEAVRAAALATLADWRTFDAAQDLLQVAKTATNPDTAATAFDGCARLCVEVEAPSGERFKVLQSLAPAAKRPVQERRLLSALGEVQTVASLQLVATYLSRPDLVNEAGAAAVKICSRLDASGKAEAAPVLNQVLKSAKAKPVLDGARKQMERLGIKAE